MADHMVKLPGNFRFVYQFDGNSQYKCVEACLAMVGQIAYPTRYANPAQLMSQIYQHYVGPDVVSDTKGTTSAQAIDWLHSQGIGSIDMSHLIGGDMEALRLEISAQNAQGVVQIISVSDESHLKYAKTGLTLHNWADSLNHGGHAFVRVGYSDDMGWGYYMEPAAAPNFERPVPIRWADIVAGGIDGCIAIMPSNVPTPPSGFSFQHGTWPEPAKPPVNHDAIASTIAALQSAHAQRKTALEQELNELNAEDSAFLNILHELGLK